MIKRAFFTSLFLLIASVAPAQNNASCDRECLRGFMTQYLNAMVAHNPGTLPVAANVRFTEDTKPLKLGEGLWKTASGLRPYRQDIIDVRQGVAAAFVIAEEGGSPLMLAVRLKVVDRKITEVEMMVTHNQQEGSIFNINALQTATKGMNVVPDRGQLNSREEAIQIAEHYPQGLKAGSFVKVDAPFASEAYRFENGQLMAGPECKFIAGCENIKAQRIPTLAQLTYRTAVVDEQAGIVLIRMDFGPGSTRGAGNSLNVFEAFKVYGGQIHAVEAFMKNMPAGNPSGWDDVYPPVK